MIRPGVIAVSLLAAVAMTVSGVGGYVGASKVVDWVDESVRAEVGEVDEPTTNPDGASLSLPIITPAFETRLTGPLTIEEEPVDLADGFPTGRQVIWENDVCAVAALDLGAERMAAGRTFDLDLAVQGGASAVQMSVSTVGATDVQGREGRQVVMTDGQQFAHVLFVVHGQYLLSLLCVSSTDSRPTELQVAIDNLVLKDGAL